MWLSKCPSHAQNVQRFSRKSPISKDIRSLINLKISVKAFSVMHAASHSFIRNTNAKKEA